VILRNEPFWINTVSDDRLLNAAAAHADFLQGPDGIALFASTYFAKPALVGKKVLWHQDGSYWPLRPMNVLTIWVAVDHAGPNNGAIQVVRGSHKWPLAKLVDDRISELNVLGARTHTDDDLADARSDCVAPSSTVPPSKLVCGLAAGSTDLGNAHQPAPSCSTHSSCTSV